jgi:hypothetical protein
MAAWVVPLIATAASTAIGMAAGGQQDSANKQAVEEQYKYDKEKYKYDAARAQDQYIFNQNEVNIARANNENELRYRETLDKQNYTAQMEQRRDNFLAQKNAYTQSEKDYADYKDLNSRIRTNAELQTQNKLSENLTSLDYANQGQKVQELQAALGLNIKQKTNNVAAKSGRRDLNLAKQINNRQFDQTTRQLNRQQDYTDSSRREATSLKNIAGRELTNDKNINELARIRQNNALTFDTSLNVLAASQANENAEDTYGDAKLLVGQNQDELRSVYANQQLQNDFSNENAELKYDASKLNNDQAKKINTLNRSKTELSIKAEKQNVALDTIERKARQTDTRLDLEDLFSTQQVEFAQSIDDLTDQERYQLFEQDTNIENLSGDLKTLKIQHDTDMSARRFEQEGARLAALEAEGNLSAQGRRGASAARTIATVLAAAGRQQAQLADSILRGTKLFDQQKLNLEGKSARAGELKKLFEASTTRKKGDVTEIEERREIDYERETKQSKDTDTRTDSRKTSLDKIFAEQVTMAKDEETLRNKQLDAQSTQRKTEQDSTIDQNKRLEAQQLLDRDRKIEDQNENLARALLDKDRSIRQTDATRDLKNSYNTQKKKQVKYEFNLNNNKLNQNNQRLMASLNANLRKLGIDDSSIKNQRTAATEDFKTAETMAANDYKDVKAQWNIGNEEIANASKINTFNTELRKNEYKSSKQSARKAANANMRGIAIDEYSANLTADKQRLPEPERAPKPPKPISYPRTFFQDPMAPVAAPKPIKGVANTSNMLGAAATGIGKLASIDFS